MNEFFSNTDFMKFKSKLIEEFCFWHMILLCSNGFKLASDPIIKDQKVEYTASKFWLEESGSMITYEFQLKLVHEKE